MGGQDYTRHAPSKMPDRSSAQLRNLFARAIGLRARFPLPRANARVYSAAYWVRHAPLQQRNCTNRYWARAPRSSRSKIFSRGSDRFPARRRLSDVPGRLSQRSRSGALACGVPTTVCTRPAATLVAAGLFLLGLAGGGEARGPEKSTGACFSGPHRLSPNVGVGEERLAPWRPRRPRRKLPDDREQHREPPQRQT